MGDPQQRPVPPEEEPEEGLGNIQPRLPTTGTSLAAILIVRALEERVGLAGNRGEEKKDHGGKMGSVGIN